MKRIVLVLLAALILALGGCGSSSDRSVSSAPAQDDMEQATTMTMTELLEDIGFNTARAETYTGNSYVITGYVYQVEKDYCVVLGDRVEGARIISAGGSGQQYTGDLCLHVYLRSSWRSWI